VRRPFRRALPDERYPLEANQILQRVIFFRDSVAVPAIVMSAGPFWYTRKKRRFVGILTIPG
jgi:hypothetical protein